MCTSNSTRGPLNAICACLLRKECYQIYQSATTLLMVWEQETALKVDFSLWFQTQSIRPFLAFEELLL